MEPLTFKTRLGKRIEIITERCSVQIGHTSNIKAYEFDEYF